MFRIRVLAIGEDKDPWVTLGIQHYSKLLSKYAALEVLPLPSPKTSSSLSPEEVKRQEASLLKEKFGKGITVALVDTGKTYDSLGFAKLIERWQSTSGGAITFLIGGPFGLDSQLVKTVNATLSLSPLTFSHQLVRLVLLEQLYRGFTILHNTGYHK